MSANQQKEKKRTVWSEWSTIISLGIGVASLVATILFGLRACGPSGAGDDTVVATPTDTTKDLQVPPPPGGVIPFDTLKLLESKLTILAKGVNQERIVDEVMQYFDPKAKVLKTEMGVNSLVGDIDYFLTTLDIENNVPPPIIFEIKKGRNNKIKILKIEN